MSTHGGHKIFTYIYIYMLQVDSSIDILNLDVWLSNGNINLKSSSHTN